MSSIQERLAQLDEEIKVHSKKIGFLTALEAVVKLPELSKIELPVDGPGDEDTWNAARNELRAEIRAAITELMQ